MQQFRVEIIMCKGMSKLLIMMTILVAFVGQALASPFFVSDDDIIITQSITLESQNEYQQGADDCCDTDCCENDCICPENACATFAYIPVNPIASELIRFGGPVRSTPTPDIHSIVTSFYRPPILPLRLQPN